MNSPTGKRNSGAPGGTPRAEPVGYGCGESVFVRVVQLVCITLPAHPQGLSQELPVASWPQGEPFCSIFFGGALRPLQFRQFRRVFFFLVFLRRGQPPPPPQRHPHHRPRHHSRFLYFFYFSPPPLSFC